MMKRSNSIWIYHTGKIHQCNTFYYMYKQYIYFFFLFQNIFMAASFPTFSKECLEEPFVYMMLMECDHDTHAFCKSSRRHVEGTQPKKEIQWVFT